MFSDAAASAICHEMGYDSSSITWANSDLWDSVQQSYDIVLDDVDCQNDNFAECTYATSHNCAHSEDIYLICGRWKCRVAFHYHSGNSVALVYWVTIYTTCATQKQITQQYLGFTEYNLNFGPNFD